MAGLYEVEHTLTKLTVSKKTGISNRKKLIRRPGSLQSLDVSRSHYLCDDILKIFFSHFNQITYLNIGNYYFYNREVEDKGQGQM